MNPIPITVTVGSVPASYVPPNDMQGVLEAVAHNTTYSTTVSGPALVANSTGAGADGNGIWVWTLQGHFLAPRVMTAYANNWWQVYTGKPGEIRMITGSPSGYFDASGWGIEASGWEGWALCNGQNNTVNFGSRFVVPGYRYAKGQGWITQVGTVIDTLGGTDHRYGPVHSVSIDTVYGGYQQMSISLWNLPAISVYLNAAGIWKHDGGTSISAPNPNQAPPWTYPFPNPYFTREKHIPISRIPPYVALGYVQFMGYRYLCLFQLERSLCSIRKA